MGPTWACTLHMHSLTCSDTHENNPEIDLSSAFSYTHSSGDYNPSMMGLARVPNA